MTDALAFEALERDMLADLHRAAPGPVREELGLEAVTVADGLVSIACRDPNILVNRTLGMGTKTRAHGASR